MLLRLPLRTVKQQIDVLERKAFFPLNGGL